MTYQRKSKLTVEATCAAAAAAAALLSKALLSGAAATASATSLGWCRTTLADISWLVVLERIRQGDNEEAFLHPQLRPHCARYWEKLQGRRAYREAIREFGHPNIDHAHRRLREAKAANPRLRRLLEG